MLILKNIVKDYVTGDTTVRAMDNISINFRENEFVSILGPSGCGKTTMLNIIGGLDKYTSGDLIINGKSTSAFTDENWDTYRNHSIGFIFQSYNLIPHQTVLSNVELALTLSGVSKKERRERAIEALKQVGLEDHINKKPNQMSGGQVQRVAIARALINNPDILLADEPTGALDSETSVQIMELLKEISKDKLIIMVTHNPDLAYEYSNRIIKFKDGRMTDDSYPFNPEAVDFMNEKAKAEEEKAKGRKPSMSFKTAFGLSLRNLATKKGRTILTAFAGSIGIIGIALVLALSTGIQNYVDKVQNDTLLAFPMSVEKESVDVNSMMTSVTGMMPTGEVDHDLENIHVNEMFTELVNTFIAQSSSNNLRSFRKYIEDNKDTFNELCNDVQYKYSTPLNIYRADTENGVVQVNPSTLMDTFSGNEMMATMEGFMGSTFSVWMELIGGKEVIGNQYDIIYGRLPENKNEVVLIVDGNNEINELVLYALGLKDQSEFSANLMSALTGGEQFETTEAVYSYQDICNMKFKLVLNHEYMVKDKKTGLWSDRRNNLAYVKSLVDDGMDINIVGIIRPGEDNVLSVGMGGIGYMTELMDYALSETEKSEVVQQQLKDPKTDVITGLKFFDLTVNDFDLADIDMKEIDMNFLDISPFMSMATDIDLSQIDITDMSSIFNFGDMTDLQKKLMEGYLDDEQVIALKQAYIDTIKSKASYEKTMETLGYQPADTPTSIYFYPKSFEAKDKLNEMIEYYNEQVRADGHPEYEIAPTDAIGALLSSVTKIIDIVTYVLVVFVAISLVVSSIMIGIITYISVLERTKEIGILRSIGASKGDVSRVFNAETITIGLAAGIIGIISTLILEIPINLLLDYLTHTGAAAQLPFKSAIILIGISVFLTFIAGLVPSSLAAKKDPVEALRTD
ncbi:MAG: ABC transporter ATP-binding protein/permease [Acutalibacteraceae bacterium]|nr:ABC transporter ATP-binding protein/permease [Acutalibacteraceae bacterium]